MLGDLCSLRARIVLGLPSTYDQSKNSNSVITVVCDLEMEHSSLKKIKLLFPEYHHLPRHLFS